MKVIIFFVLSLLAWSGGYAQCKNFAMDKKEALGSYIHDGAFNASQLSSGQTVQLFKTLYKGQKYRIVVAGSEQLKQFEMRILDLSYKTIYVNYDANLTKIWDFTVENTSSFIISVKGLQSGSKIEEGCVAVLFGFKSKEASLR